ncbi:YqaI family protein [Virgibacillus kimchii]
MDIQHPDISKARVHGQLREMMDQPEHSGIDALGTEILSGDKIYEFGHETVLEDNLEEFLVEHLGVEIREAQ